MNWYKKAKEQGYVYVGTCAEVCEDDGGQLFEDATQMGTVLEIDSFSYSDSTYHHNPENQITPEQFEQIIGDTLDNVKKNLSISNNIFIGKTKIGGMGGIIFIYDDDSGLHHFWE